MWIGQLDTFSLAWIRLDFRLVIPRELSGLCQWTYLSITCSGLCSGTRRAGQPWVGSRKANSDCWVWKKREKKVGWLFSDGNLELWDPFSRGSLYTHTDTRLWTSKWWCGSIIKMRQEKRNYPQWVLRTKYSTSTLVHVSTFLFFFLLHWQGKWQDHHKYSSWNRSQNNNTNTEFTATYGVVTLNMYPTYATRTRIPTAWICILLYHIIYDPDSGFTRLLTGARTDTN